MQTIINYLDILFKKTFELLVQFAIYVCEALIWNIIQLAKIAFQSLLMIANALIALMPACQAPWLNPSDFVIKSEAAGLPLTLFNWIIPFNQIAIVVGCLINAVMVYLMISWVLRWLKVIK